MYFLSLGMAVYSSLQFFYFNKSSHFPLLLKDKHHKQVFVGELSAFWKGLEMAVFTN